MQTRLADFINNSPQGREAEAIIRSCVHCGFCNSVCPTYRLLGDELDGPRGRIYLIKSMLEGEAATANSRLHLDRCLSCRACETVCPSGVRYHRLLDIGRELTEKSLFRPWRQSWLRRCLRAILPYSRRVGSLAAVCRFWRPLLPNRLKRKLPGKQLPGVWPKPRHQRRMLILEGCVQPALAPRINAATARVLDGLGISLIRVQAAGCCGALPYHLGAHNDGLNMMRSLIDAWWPLIEAGAEAIVVTASGCGAMIKDYGELLREDPSYAKKAALISASAKDIAEILQGEDLSGLQVPPRKIAFQSPCSLQHGQALDGAVEALLSRLGFELAFVSDAEQCCGSAGTYAILQPEIAEALRDAKLSALQAGSPDLIVTANIGCLLHLQEKSAVQVRHWIELLEKTGR